MALIQFTERDKKKADAFDGVEAVFDGRTHTIKIYPGDTRPHAVKIAAIKECLALRIEDEAKRLSRPLPDKEPR